MPRHSSRNSVSSRLHRRSRSIDPKRSELLEKILNESSSILLNDVSNQTNPKQALENHSRLLDLIHELRQVESTCKPKLPERSEKNWTNFFSWLEAEHEVSFTKTLGVSNQDPKLNEREYSLITKVPLKKGDQILSVNRKVMLSTETATQDHSLFDFIKTDTIASSMQNVVLVLHLLNEHSKDENSFWAPYLAILPDSILPVLKLNKDELKSLLPSSHIFEILKMIRAISRQYSYFFARLQATNLPLSRNFTFDYYCWGVSMVCSRQNEIPPVDRKVALVPTVHALIPVLDMCNHNYSSNQAVFENHHSSLIASKDLNIGDGITINYGTRSSGDFYIHNGFVPEELPYDTVPITFALNRQDHLLDAKSKLLKTLNMPIFGKFRLTINDRENRHRRDPHLTMFLIVYLMNEEELEFTLKSDNPVGIADKIYEYVQYEHSANNEAALNDKDENETEQVSIMKSRVLSCIKEYTSKRASIAIALIDRTLDSDKSIDTNISMLLKHERFIYEGYLINCYAK